MMIKTPLSTAIGGVGFYTKNAVVIGSGHKSEPEPPFNIASLFANGEQGLFYDPHTLDGVGQTIGLLPDLSGNNNHGSNANSAQQALLNLDAATGYKYLSFDGTDDCYVTQAIDLTHTSKVTVIAAVKLLDSKFQLLLETSNNYANNVGAFELSVGEIRAGAYTFSYKSDSRTNYTGQQVKITPRSGVVRASIDASNPSNSVVLAENNDTSVTKSEMHSLQNLGNYPLYVGRRNAKVLPFLGHLYAILIIDRILTDAEIQKVEAEFAKRMGITL